MGPKRKAGSDEQELVIQPPKSKRMRKSTKVVKDQDIAKPFEVTPNQTSNGSTNKLIPESIPKALKPDLKQENKSSRSMFIGAHVSAAGGVHNAVKNAVSIGCKSFALFLSNQRQWNTKLLDPKVVDQFKEEVEKAQFDMNHILPHGSYLMNCGSPQAETLQKSRAKLISELQRCEVLGLTKYNFHPGSTCGKIPVEKSVELIAESINEAHKETKFVMAVLENMSCQGNTIGGKFEELAAIIDKVEDKSRVGVCIDTCHAFAAGFDIRTKDGWNSLMTEFEDKIGLQYFQAMHLNDSKGELNSHLDRHEIIGKNKGKIGLETFRTIVNDPRCAKIPLVVETPAQDEMANWEREIKLLYSLVE